MEEEDGVDGSDDGDDYMEEEGDDVNDDGDGDVEEEVIMSVMTVMMLWKRSG